MLPIKKTLSAALASLTVTVVSAETHTVHFTNNCGFGIPTLIQYDNVLSTGADYTIDGPLRAAIAYLQTGSCGFNGEGCTLVELTLINPVNGPGIGSSADISLIPPQAFSVASGFSYYNGCEGVGINCTSASCPTAPHNPWNSWPQVVCQANDVNMAITFCP
ncbi:Glp-like protein [Panaeolus papilionaceus]|nr:Glp-like protein [Panaeolus papilionaceus]